MAENKKPIAKVWVTTDQKTSSKPSTSKTGVVREKSSYSGRITEGSIEKFRKGGHIKPVSSPCGDKKDGPCG